MSSRAIIARIKRLEQVRGVGEPCSACGEIDPASRSGPFSPGFMLPAPDGTYWCVCKRCGRMFRGQVETDGNRVFVSDIVPEAPPV